MKRRQLLGLAGGTVVSTVALGAMAPPAQAFIPFLFRLLLGAATRDALKQEAAARKQAKQVPQATKPKSKVRRRNRHS